MPHIVVEYTANIRDDARIPALLRTINATLIAQGGVFPTGGIRSRAIELHDYCVADGTEDDAFVHVTLKIGSGRTDAQKKPRATRCSTRSRPISPSCTRNAISRCRWN